MLHNLTLRLKWVAFWLADLTAVLEFLLHRKQPRSGLTVLCYHRIAENLPVTAPFDPFNVTPATFSWQMASLRSLHDVTVVSAKWLADWIRKGGIPTGSYLMFTFDDGYHNSLEAAVRLHREGWPGIFFVTTGYIGKPVFDFNPFDVWCKAQHLSDSTWYAPLTLADCRKLLDLQMEVQPHGHLHRPLGRLQTKETHEEIQESKNVIQIMLGCEAIAFSYPYGSSRANHFNRSVEECLSNMGFRFAVSTDAGRNELTSIETKAFRLRRVPVHEHDKGLFFQAKAAGYAGALPVLKALAYTVGVWTRVPPREQPARLTSATK